MTSLIEKGGILDRSGKRLINLTPVGNFLLQGVPRANVVRGSNNSNTEDASFQESYGIKAAGYVVKDSALMFGALALWTRSGVHSPELLNTVFAFLTWKKFGDTIYDAFQGGLRLLRV